MDIYDEFMFQRFSCFDKDESTLTRHLDLTPVAEVDAKLSKVVDSVVSFLIQSGFKEQELIDELDALVSDAKSHPDNDDFSFESQVEDAVKDEKQFEKFVNDLSMVIERLDTESTREQAEASLREVFRRWLYGQYVTKRGVSPAKD